MMILNMKVINTYIPSTLPNGEASVHPAGNRAKTDWAVSLALKDAYFYIPIHSRSRYLLGFPFPGETFKFRAMHFRLRPPPPPPLLRSYLNSVDSGRLPEKSRPPTL